VKPGDLVMRTDPLSPAKLFVEPYAKWKSVIREESGVIGGIGVVLEILETDVRILTPTCSGWCYVGNVKVIS